MREILPATHLILTSLFNKSKKQQQISAVAAHYLQANQLFDQPCRFVDVVAIRLNWQNRLIDLQHIENAFLYAAAAES